jgi:DedD protein
VFVPMLLESDERPLGDDVSVRIPPVDQGKFVNRLNAPAGAPPASPRPAPSKSDAGAAATGSSGDVASTPAPQPAASGAIASTSAGPAAGDAGKAAAPAANPAPQKADAPAPSAKSTTTSAKPVAETPTKAAAAKPAGAGYVVQLAAFSDDKGANALANRLKKSGHPAFTEPVTTSRGTLWRVRVGPYATRDEANTARDRLKREGQNGIVAARAS